MAQQGSDKNGVRITSASSTASFHDISNYVTSISGVKIEALLEMTHAFGDAWEESSPVGVKRVDDITLGGPYNDVAASGPHVLLGDANVGADRVLKIYVSSGESIKGHVWIKSYERKPVRNQLAAFEAVCTPSGSWATST